MTRPVVLWPPPGATADDVAHGLPVLQAALDGTGPAVATPGTMLDAATRVPDETAVVVSTSGTTGPPKPALLGATAVRLAVSEVQDAVGGPGQWLLALPPSHVSGLQVVLRNLAGGEQTHVVGPGRFTPAAFVAAARRLTGERRYVSLVPTQLRRLLDDADAVACARELDRVLVGAARLPAADRARARALGLEVIDGYGCSETAGGCVYDGVPLASTRLRLDDDGRVHLGGPQVALGYLHRDDGAFHEVDGERWFATSDHGELVDGRLRLLGRLDDVVTTGGLKVAPAVVEDALGAARCGVAQAMVLGVPDQEWGEAVVALVVPQPGAHPTTAQVRAALADLLPAHALPRAVHVVAELPVRGAGKPDRAAARALVTTR